MATPKPKTNAQARKIHDRRARMSLPEQVRAANDVYVHVSGSPRSVAALLWTFQQGRMDAKVVYYPTRCEGSVHVEGVQSPLTRSYVKALAEAFGLEYLERGEVVDVENVTVSGSSLPGSATVAPFAGRSEEDALELLDVAGVRPHPGVVLGGKSLCDDAALKRLAKRPQHDFEHSLAAAMVLSSDFPAELLFYGDGQARVKDAARRPSAPAKSAPKKSASKPKPVPPATSKAAPSLQALADASISREDLKANYRPIGKSTELDKYGYQIVQWWDPRPREGGRADVPAHIVEFVPRAPRGTKGATLGPRVTVSALADQLAFHKAIGAPLPSNPKPRKRRPDWRYADSDAAPDSAADDDKLEAAIRANGEPDYVAWMGRARTAQEGRVVLHVLDEELRGYSRAVLNNINPPADPERVIPGEQPADRKRRAKHEAPILDDFFVKADALDSAMGARIRSLYQQHRTALSAWQPLYAKEKAGG